MALIDFFTRDTRFFDLLEVSAAEARQGATLLAKLYEQLGKSAPDILLADIAQSRRNHKTIANQTAEALTRTFMTPLDREDIEALSRSLYRISKTIEKAGERLTICPPGTKLEMMASELPNIVHATQAVETLIGMVRHGATLDKIAVAHQAVEAIEGDADKCLIRHLRELYETELDARLIVFWKDLYDLLEKITDRCRDVGNRVLQIALKNS